MPRAMTVPDRVWPKVDKNGPNGCWLWTGTKARGYGQMIIAGKTAKAYRVVYELVIGPVPEGLVLDHLCRNPPCVNPAHMEPVTQAENVRRGNLAVFTPEQVEEIKARLREVESMRVIAADYGVHENTIWHIAAGWTWGPDGFGPGGEIIRPVVHCRECGVLITTGQRHKRFCCALHRTRFNAREARRAARARS